MIFLAGKKALEIIREKGLSQEMVKVIAGAAGGPKWIILSGLDRFIFSSWLDKNRVDPLYLVGSSIGVFRFAAAMCENAGRSIDVFLDAYIKQAYDGKPTPADVTGKGLEILDTYLNDKDVRDVLQHSFLRLNILVARCKGLTSVEKPLPLTTGFLGAAVINLFNRGGLRLFFERTLFYDARNRPPFFGMNQFPTEKVPLNPENLKSAILASGSIPYVMKGVKNIPGTHGGMFRDGGILDYHLDIPYNIDDGIVLFPHYTDRIIPGWLDKSLPYRVPQKKNVERVLLVAPARKVIEELPYQKIPCRKDFSRFLNKDHQRFEFWNHVAEKSRSLACEFADILDKGRIKDLVRPLEC